MKCLLVNPIRTGRDSYVSPPLHLVYVGTHIKKAGHPVEIFDSFFHLVQEQKATGRPAAEIESELIQRIAGMDYDLLGIGSIVSSYTFSKRLVNAVKARRPDLPVIIGGNMSMPLNDLWFAKTRADFLVESDGELVIERFLAAWPDREKVARIPGVHVRGEQGFDRAVPPELPQDLDCIQFPDWDLLPNLPEYLETQRKWTNKILPQAMNLGESDVVMPIVMSRGCAFRCTFCYHVNNFYRKHSVDYLLRYLGHLKRKYGVTAIITWDDLVMLNRKWLATLCDAIADAGLGLRLFTSGGKPNLMNREILRKMRRAGFERISYGIESGSQKILDIMRKKTTVEQNYQAVKTSVEEGIFTHLNMIVGMPGESVATLWETLRFLSRLAREGYITRQNVSYSFATGYPGTELYEYMRRQGFVTDTEKYLEEQVGVGEYFCNLSSTSRKMLGFMHLLTLLNVDFHSMWREGRRAEALCMMAWRVPRLAAAHTLPKPVKAAIKRLLGESKAEG